MPKLSNTWLAAAASAACSVPAAADEPALAWSAVYTGDVTGVVGGTHPHAGRYLDNLDLTADLDLDKAVGWQGATLHAYVLNNAGGAPNDRVGSLQGVDNIEVARPRLRLYELWLQQELGDSGVSALAGLYDLNSEFYANDSAGLLIAPPFGIGSELAATGANGPSIFPSTALGVRVNADVGEGRYLRAAVLNARSGVLGDPGGVDWSFGGGVLAIAEAGTTGPRRFSAGAWRYSRRQDDIRDMTPAGEPARRRAQGAYVLGEQRLFGGGEGPEGAAFLRLGVSDGKTTPFKGGWQAGVLVSGITPGRPDSQVSLGVQQGVLNRKFRANLRDAGVRAARAESGVELTYADRVGKRVTLQPDVQWIRHAGGDRDADDRVVVAFRVTVDLGPLAGE